MRLTARVPATSANLGPGFDAFALALDLCNEVVLDTDGAPGVSWDGEGGDELPTDGTDLVSRAIAATFRRHPGLSAPTFSLHGFNRIPLERGLGSSAAAAVAGTALANALIAGAGTVDLGSISAAAAELEGHPDNAAAAAFGGLTVVAGGFVHRMDVAPDVSPVVMVPVDVRMPTDQARAVLPEIVPLADAVANVAHGSLVVQALVSGDLDLLRVALGGDRLHQAARLALVPDVAEVFTRTARRSPVCLSGSGPSLLAFEGPDAQIDEPGEGWRALRPAVRPRGIEVLEG
jgi:homoserine kinase